MIKVDTLGEIQIIQLGASLDLGASDEFKLQFKSWLLLPIKTYVLDFEQTKNILAPFYQALIQFRSALKGTEKSIYSINLNTSLLRQVNEDGVSQIFSSAESIENIKRKSDLVKKTSANIDVDLINPFLKGAIKTLEVQANTKVKPLKIHMKSGPAENIGIAGVISLVTDTFTGSITLCFPQKVFLKIYENMFGEVHLTINKEIEDAAGELLNIIYGQAKIELNNKPGYNLKKAIPTILVGEKLNISLQGNSATVVIPFETEFGNFYIEIETQYH